MAIPSPEELIAQYGAGTPELLARALGFEVTRAEEAPLVPGVTVMSAYEPRRAIVLYQKPLRAAAAQRGEPFARFEQWHVAHELYHGLAESTSLSMWRVRETEADVWADELMALISPGENVTP